MAEGKEFLRIWRKSGTGELMAYWGNQAWPTSKNQRVQKATYLHLGSKQSSVPRPRPTSTVPRRFEQKLTFDRRTRKWFTHPNPISWRIQAADNAPPQFDIDQPSRPIGLFVLGRRCKTQSFVKRDHKLVEFIWFGQILEKSSLDTFLDVTRIGI